MTWTFVGQLLLIIVTSGLTASFVFTDSIKEYWKGKNK